MLQSSLRCKTGWSEPRQARSRLEGSCLIHIRRDTCRKRILQNWEAHETGGSFPSCWLALPVCMGNQAYYHSINFGRAPYAKAEIEQHHVDLCIHPEKPNALWPDKVVSDLFEKAWIISYIVCNIIKIRLTDIDLSYGQFDSLMWFRDLILLGQLCQVGWSDELVSRKYLKMTKWL